MRSDEISTWFPTGIHSSWFESTLPLIGCLSAPPLPLTALFLHLTLRRNLSTSPSSAARSVPSGGKKNKHQCILLQYSEFFHPKKIHFPRLDVERKTEQRDRARPHEQARERERAREVRDKLIHPKRALARCPWNAIRFRDKIIHAERQALWMLCLIALLRLV